MLARGEGTRAIIYGMDSTATNGHVWNAVVQNGVVRYIDGQLGAGGALNFNTFSHFRYGITTNGR
jgi:hypothetical protein